MHYQKVCLHSFGLALPPRVLSSEKIEAELAPLTAA